MSIMSDDGRRRIDRILEPSYVEDLPQLSADDLRERRADCREEEDVLSFTRRLLHGKLDILRAELELRRDRGQSDADQMVERLGEVLGAGVTPSGGRGARSRLPSGPAQEAGRRRAEQVASESHLARLPDLSNDELAGVLEELVAEERQVSAQRSSVHAVIDRLEEELVRRYREDGLSPPGVVDAGGRS
jgi:hypothetical protein